LLGCQQGFDQDPEDDEDRVEIALRLIKKEARVNIRSHKSKMSAMHWAAYHDDVELVEELLKVNAKVTKDSKGRTPLDIAANTRKTHVVNLFFDYFLTEL
jgi:ankyrin repeat protein